MNRRTPLAPVSEGLSSGFASRSSVSASEWSVAREKPSLGSSVRKPKSGLEDAGSPLDNVTAGSKRRSCVTACLERRVSAFTGKAQTRKAEASAKSQPASPACLRRQCRTIVSGAIIAPNINQGQQRLHRLRASHTFSLQAKSPSLDQRRRPRQFLSGDRQNFRR